jgi:RNA polymerase sigma-70 factor (ECF subfamily)
LEESEAFAQFYENTHQDIYRYVMASCGGNVTLAEDVTAETYLRAWKNRRSFSGTSEGAFGWVLTISRRLLIDKFRTSSSRPPENELVDEIEDRDQNTETILLNHVLSEQIIEALQILPEERRELVLLRYVLGWRVNQIADYLAMSENTISVSIRRSLKQLQDFLIMQGVRDERSE